MCLCLWYDYYTLQFVLLHIFFHSESHHTAEVKWLVNPFSRWLHSKMCNTSLRSSIKQQSSNILFKICLFVERLQHYLSSKRMIQVNINVKGVQLRKGLWTRWTRELIFTSLWEGFLVVLKVSGSNWKLYFCFSSVCFPVSTGLMDSDCAMLCL